MALFIMIAASLKLNAQTTIWLPIEFAKLGNGECIVVKGLGLNGLNLNFIFDTGGSGSGIDQETIDALGLKPDTTITAKGAGGEMKIAHFGKRDLKTGDGNVSIATLRFEGWHENKWFVGARIFDRLSRRN